MDARPRPRRLQVVLAVAAAALAAALAPSPARAAADCTPAGDWKLTVELGSAQAIENRLARVRAAAGLPPLATTPALTKLAMFKAMQLAQLRAATNPSPNPNLGELAAACDVPQLRGMAWNWSSDGATAATLDWWLKEFPYVGERTRSASAVGIGAARGTDGVVYFAAAWGDANGDPGAAVWPVAGWPAFPSSKAAPGTPATSGTRVCITAAECGFVELRVEDGRGRWSSGSVRSYTLGGAPRPVKVCVSFDAESGEPGKVDRLLAAARLNLHTQRFSLLPLGRAQARVLAPVWQPSTDGLSRCASVSLPHGAPVAQGAFYGLHSSSLEDRVWFTLMLSGTAVASAKAEYLIGTTSLRVGKARSQQRGRNVSVRVPVSAELFRYASPRRPITVVCMQQRSFIARAGGRTSQTPQRPAATITLTRPTTKPVICRYTLPSPRYWSESWSLRADVKRSAKLDQVMSGMQLARGGFTLWMR